MNRRLLLSVFMFILVLIPAGGIVYLVGTPSVRRVSPGREEEAVPASADVRISFSRPMQVDTVLDRLSINPAQNGKYHWEENTLVFVPEGLWSPGADVTVRLEPGARAAGLLAFPIREETGWTFQVIYPRLAYLYPSDAASNIHLLDPLTGESQQVTSSRAGVYEYDLDSDGRYFYYSARNSQGGSSIYRVELAPEEPVEQPDLIVSCPQAECRLPAVSPYGEQLAYERTAFSGTGEPTYPQVWLMPLTLDGSQPARVGAAGHQTMTPQWSPTNLLTFYDTNESAFVILEPQTGERINYPNQTGDPGSWDPQGQHYVAAEVATLDVGEVEQSQVRPVISSRLIRFDMEDQETEDLTRAGDLEDGSPAYSTDGNRIAFARRFLDLDQWTPGRQLWVMSESGLDAVQLTDDPFYNHYNFTWNPMGEHVAYVRFNMTDLSRPPEIWLLNLATGESERLVVGGYAPQWVR